MTYTEKYIEGLIGLAQPTIDDYARRMSLHILPPEETDGVLPFRHRTEMHDHTVLDLIAFDDDGSGQDAWRTGQFRKISLVCRCDHEFVEGWVFCLISGWVSTAGELRRLVELQVANQDLHGVASLSSPKQIDGEWVAVLETGLDDDIIVRSGTEFGITLQAGEIAASLGLVIIDKDEGEYYE